MEIDTLNRLEELVASQLDLNQIIDNTAVTSTPAAVLPGGVSVQSLEHLLQAPRRFVGSYATKSRKAFVSYCEDHADENSAVFVDPDKMTARAIFDLGDAANPQWGKHLASLACQSQPAFEAINGLAQSAHTQRALIEFFEDWRSHIKPVEADGKEIPFAQALQAIRSVDVKAIRDASSEVGDFNVKRTALEQIDVSSKHKLPAGFEFTCIPYPDFGTRTLPCRLWVKTHDENLQFGVRIVGFEEIKEEIAQEFLTALVDAPALEKVDQVHIGTFAYRS